MALSEWTASAVQNLPKEANLVRKVVKALKDAGTPVVNVWDGEELVPVSGEHQVLDAVFAVDMSWLRTASGAEVLIILGNEWDAVSDYSESLEAALDPVIQYAIDQDSY